MEGLFNDRNKKLKKSSRNSVPIFIPAQLYQLIKELKL